MRGGRAVAIDELDTLEDLPSALNRQGLRCKDLAQHDEARAYYERALVILEQSPTRREGDVATLYHNLGGIEHARRDFVAAEAFARRGLALRRVLNDDDALAADLVALGAILDGQQKFDEAETLYLEGLAILERSPARNRGEIAVALNNLGAQYLVRGRVTEALRLLTRALRLKLEYLDTRHPDVAVTLNNLAEARKRHGDLDRAERLCREAVEIFQTALSAGHPTTAACRRNLSTLEQIVMSTNNEGRHERDLIRINLTAQQKEVVKAATHRDAEAIEFTVEELEKRIAPLFTRLAGNHNETLLADGGI
jgi:tetratricopeptide (TPR) repeat protein